MEHTARILSEAEATDLYTMKSCRHLIKRCQDIPPGETVETLGEFIEVHRVALHAMPQRTGKGALVLEIGLLAKKYPPDFALASHDASDPYQHPDMVAAKEIFGGEWIKP